MMKYRLFWLFLGFALLAVLGSWHLFFAPKQIEVAAVQEGAAAELVYATGVVEPMVSATLSAEVAGRLASFSADEGDKVATGQELGQLDLQKESALAADAAARLDKAQRDLTRAKTLLDKKSGSQESYDNAKTELNRAEASYKALSADTERRVFKAPFDGILTRREGEVGEFVLQGRTVFEVAQTDKLRVTLDVDEEDIARVLAGQKVLLTADAFPAQVFEATITDITPQGDSLNKSYRVRANLPAATPLPLGMTVEANIVLLEKPKVLLIPSTALTPEGHVFVVAGHHVKKVAPTLGIKGLETTEVQSGLALNDQIALKPAGLSDGQRVSLHTPAPQGK